MADTALQTESAQAKPLTFHAIGSKLEDLEAGPDEIAALAYIMSRDQHMDPEIQTAFGALGRMAATWGAALADLREEVYAASDAERGGNVAEFSPRG